MKRFPVRRSGVLVLMLLIGLSASGCGSVVSTELFELDEPQPSEVSQPETIGAAIDLEDDDAVEPEILNMILGMKRESLTAMFGEPAFAWKEAENEMLRWDTEQCSVFVFVHVDAVDHVETRGRGTQDGTGIGPADDQCACSFTRTCS